MHVRNRLRRRLQLVAWIAPLSLMVGCKIYTNLETTAGRSGMALEPSIQLIDPSPPIAIDRIVALSDSGAVLWDCVAEDCFARSQLRLTYGQVPRGFRRLTPRVGMPAPLEEGQRITLVISDRFREANCGVAELTRSGDQLYADDYLFYRGQPARDDRVRMLLGDR